ncbi:MAG TPA: PQQ-binding-like beta-propeller repeat protein [Gaiellaceae bacterium]|nr:PQQ-binding-like beta-propeller repeat protein [Gaiellaceae bacterium]
MRRVPCLAAAVLLGLVLTGTAVAGDWSRYGGDAQVTNDVSAAAAKSTGIDAKTAGNMQQRWQANLDGGLVASPLYLDALNGMQPLVYVATENGSVYALNASTGSVVWKRTFPTYETPDCGTYGISSTGVIDRSRGVLYVAAANGKAYALDLATGTTAPGWPVQLPIDPTTGYVWGALTLVGTTLYAPVSSFCDEPSPNTGLFPTGGLYAIDTATASNGVVFAVSGTHNLGGIWGYGGASVDPDNGDLWVATGNSEPLGAGETKGFAEAVVELDPSLNVIAWNRPAEIPAEELDTDFGSTPLLFQPDGCPPLAAAHNKNGNLYIWRRDNLAGGPIVTMQIGPHDLNTPFLAEPSWSSDLQTLYISNARLFGPTGVTDYSPVVALTVGPNCTFPSKPTWAVDAGLGTKPPPLVVGDVLFVAGGDATSFSIIDANTGLLLRVFFLGDTLYSSPILAGNDVVVGNSSGSVFAFAAPQSATPAPTPRHRIRRRHLPGT